MIRRGELPIGDEEATAAIQATLPARGTTLTDLIMTVVHFYGWTVEYVLHSLSCSQFWCALDWLIQFRTDEAEAAKSDPLGTLSRAHR